MAMTIVNNMMKERENNYENNRRKSKRNAADPFLAALERKAYIAGATEQKAIDIEKAKTAFGKACGWLSTYPWYNGVFEEFIKSIEE